MRTQLKQLIPVLAIFGSLGLTPAVAAELHGKVTAITAGNEIVVSSTAGRHTVKLHDIELPTGQGNRLNAKEALSALALGRDVTIKPDGRGTANSYLTGTVQLDGPEFTCMSLDCPKPGLPDVGLNLLQRGLVIVAPRASVSYIEAQVAAKQAAVGVWTKVRANDR